LPLTRERKDDADDAAAYISERSAFAFILLIELFFFVSLLSLVLPLITLFYLALK